MSIVAPKGRQHLSADALLRLVRRGCTNIPDHRGSATEIALADALMAALAMFSLTSPSLLAFDKHRVEGNVGTIYGIDRVPCEWWIRHSSAVVPCCRQYRPSWAANVLVPALLRPHQGPMFPAIRQYDTRLMSHNSRFGLYFHRD